MPQTRYMELDSNYRNRQEFPNPSAFEVNISMSGMRTNLNALDPITNAYPEIVFRPDDFVETTVTYTAPTGPNTLSDCSSSPVFIVSGGSTGPTGYNVGVDDYYNGAVMIDGPTGKHYRILDWKVMDTNPTGTIVEKVTVDSTIDLSSDLTFTIYNPTTIPNQPYVFIPTSKCIDNYYNKYVLWNQTLNTSVNISSYDGITHLAKLDGNVSAFQKDHVYVIRRENPIGEGALAVSTYTGAYSNWFEIQQRVDDSYINSFIRLYKNTSASASDPIDVTTGLVNPTSNIIARITGVKAYQYVDPTVFPPPTPVPINTIILDNVPVDVVNNPANYNYEIMPFTIDNYSPFVFNGSITSQNQPVAHEITLNSLVLPNVPLKNGGRIAYYPYVYVEIENVSASASSNKNIIYSNNPHTYKAIFKVPITDMNHPSVSPFVKLTGNSMTQTITFKQNDNMRVSVKLPSGDIFETVKNDTPAGQAPDPFIQVSFCFGVQRV